MEITELSIAPMREDVLKLHILYLEKLEYLSKGEREVYELYFNHMSQPIVFIDTEKPNYTVDKTP